MTERTDEGLKKLIQNVERMADSCLLKHVLEYQPRRFMDEESLEKMEAEKLEQAFCQYCEVTSSELEKIPDFSTIPTFPPR